MVNPHAGDAEPGATGADHSPSTAPCVTAPMDAASPNSVRSMYPPVPDLASPAIQAMSDGALFAIVRARRALDRHAGVPFRAFGRRNVASRVVHPAHAGACAAKDLEHGDADGSGHARRDDAAAIAMDGTTFTPETITVKVGDTVTWINKDPFPHDISCRRRPSVGRPRTGRRWQFHAAKPGTFPYVCTLHPGMKGTLIVTP